MCVENLGRGINWHGQGMESYKLNFHQQDVLKKQFSVNLSTVTHFRLILIAC